MNNTDQIEFVQSANSLFNFVEKKKFLTDVLGRKALVPRYCNEKIDYLKLTSGTQEVLVLQKCFCDIPFHQLNYNFPVRYAAEGNELLSDDNRSWLENHNTHPDYYGKYAIAFSKTWCMKNNIQPIHYINPEASYACDFNNTFSEIYNSDDVSDVIFDDVINRLSYMKPMSGIMERMVDGRTSPAHIIKNFYDECEWRYIPTTESLKKLHKGKVIVKPGLIKEKLKLCDELEDKKYEELWLKFDYNDIAYLVVPDNQARIELIEFINSLDEKVFEDNLQKCLLISKIIVLSEVKGDG